MSSTKEKQERFKKVAGNRTNRIIEQIRLLGNCSNKSNYDYSDEEIKKIFNAIDSELRETKKKYTEKTNKQKFTL